MTSEFTALAKNLFNGNLDVDPVRLTFIQSILVAVLASVLSVGLYLMVGVYFPNVWYQLTATLVIASFVAPIFLYPSFKTSTQLRQAIKVINKQAMTDHLTGLPNSFALAVKLEEQCQNHFLEDDFAVHFLDLNRFMEVNDSLGHNAGNQLLIEVAAKLQACVGAAGFVARFGGDEFIIVQHAVSCETDAIRFASLLRAAVSAPYDLGVHQVPVDVTIGIALVPLHGSEPDQVMIAADMALHKAKQENIEFYVFEGKLAEDAKARRTIENILTGAIENEHLKVYFQSIVRLDNPLQIVGFEALARLELSNGDVIMPDNFIPVAEKTGMIVEIGEWILKQACLECAEWPSELRIAVNVSPVQFLRSDFLKIVKEALADSGLAASRLELEITESVLINDIAEIEPVLRQLRALGVCIALDDFGSGFCGLHYLRQFTIDKIKVDKSIMDDACTSQVAANILRSVSNIANEMGLTVTVEGIDSIAKAEFLTREKCAHEVQGYLYSRPVPAFEARQMLEFMYLDRSSAKIISLRDYSRNRKTG